MADRWTPPELGSRWQRRGTFHTYIVAGVDVRYTTLRHEDTGRLHQLQHQVLRDTYRQITGEDTAAP